MSRLLNSLQPWIAQTVYKTITFDKNDYFDGNDDIDSRSDVTLSTSTISPTGILKLDRRPRLAQVIDSPITIPSLPDSKLVPDRSSTIQKNIFTATKNGKAYQQRMPRITRFNISDGRCFIPVYIIHRKKSKHHSNSLNKNANENSTPNNTKSNQSPDHLSCIKKGALVSLRNWTVACNSILFHSIPSSHFMYDSSLPMCLIVDERLNVSNTITTSARTQRSNYNSCLESMGGEGMSIVGPLLNVHNEIDVKRALYAVFDPIVLVRQVLECHNFHIKQGFYSGASSADAHVSGNRKVGQRFMTMMGSCNDEPDIIGTDVLDNSDTIAEILDAKRDLYHTVITLGERESSSHVENQNEAVDSEPGNRQLEQEIEQEQEQETEVETEVEQETEQNGDGNKKPHSSDELEKKMDIMQESINSFTGGGRVDYDEIMKGHQNDTRQQNSRISESHDSVFASIEEMLVSEEEKDECQQNKDTVITSLALQPVSDNITNHFVSDIAGQTKGDDSKAVKDKTVCVPFCGQDKLKEDTMNSCEFETQQYVHVQEDYDEESEKVQSTLFSMDTPNQVPTVQQGEEKEEIEVEQVQDKDSGIGNCDEVETRSFYNKRDDNEGKKKGSLLSTINISQVLPLEGVEEENKTEDKEKYQIGLEAQLPNNICMHTKTIDIAKNNPLIVQDEEEEENTLWPELETQQSPVCEDITNINKNQGREPKDKIMPVGTVASVLPVNKSLATISGENTSRGQPFLGNNDDHIIQKDEYREKHKLATSKTGNRAKRTHTNKLVSLVTKQQKVTTRTHYKNSSGRIVRKDLPYNISGWLKQHCRR